MDHFRFIAQENKDKNETGANKVTHVLRPDWEAGVMPESLRWSENPPSNHHFNQREIVSRDRIIKLLFRNKCV